MLFGFGNQRVHFGHEIPDSKTSAETKALSLTTAGSLTIAGKFLYIPRLSAQFQSHARSCEPHFSILLKVDFNRAPCSRVEWGSSEIIRVQIRRLTVFPH